MNKDYISGFFDADGYITITKRAKNEEETPVAGFTNTIKEILVSIQNFLYKEIGIKGHISLKKGNGLQISDSYDLKYTGFTYCILLGDYLSIIHPKKVKRFLMLPTIKKVTFRNGKYQAESLEKRRLLCQKFLNIN